MKLVYVTVFFAGLWGGTVTSLTATVPHAGVGWAAVVFLAAAVVAAGFSVLANRFEERARERARQRDE